MNLSVHSLSDLSGVVQEFLSFINGKKVIAFEGEMGVGKTTFISKILNEIGIKDTDGSPTYSIVNEYHSPMIGRVYHFDFFRLKDGIEALEMGVEEMLYGDALCFIEWPEKIADLLPEESVWVYIRKLEDDSRTVTVEL